MEYNETKEKSIKTINDLFLKELKKNFPKNLFEKYQESLLKMVKKEIEPICENIIEKNESKLKSKFNEISQIDNIDNEEKQIKFNEELNSLFNILGKAKMLKKAYIIQKNGINFIKYNEGQFSKNNKKRVKEEKTFANIKKEYSI